MTSWASASSISVPAFVIIGIAASCPADVTLVMDIRVACSGESPELTQNIPKAKATEKYPRQIGMPSLSPFFISFI